MKTIILSTLLLSASLPGFAAAQLPGDAVHGKSVHEKSCAGCHNNMTDGKGDTLYTRDNRRVTSLDRLMGQVIRCNSMQKLGLAENDLDGITKYLNESFYKFEE
ncbi:MAG TPA: hypothetical protein DDW55_02510 [Gammaproteobacteria bacterium]|nr:hypothetical protein [Gammaproteobacteria bacterium]